MERWAPLTQIKNKKNVLKTFLRCRKMINSMSLRHLCPVWVAKFTGLAPLFIFFFCTNAQVSAFFKIRYPFTWEVEVHACAEPISTFFFVIIALYEEIPDCQAVTFHRLIIFSCNCWWHGWNFAAYSKVKNSNLHTKYFFFFVILIPYVLLQ